MSSKIKGLRRVGIVGLSTVVAASMMSLSAVSAQAAWAASGGEIGLVDTDTTTATNGTQGATLIKPGVAGQVLGDIRLLIPNSFRNGDTIDLTIFDRSATNNDDGQINADTAHRLGFTTAPTVAVNATPYAGFGNLGAPAATPAVAPLPATHIGPNSSSPDNTEGTTANGNAATPDTLSTKATTPPVFTTTLVQSSRANNLATDIIRLTINGVQAAGDATDVWQVRLSGLTATLGSAVSPGELRVVPFAYDGTPGQVGTLPSALFGNTSDDTTTAGFDPTIATYTVPAYVAPVDFTIAAPTNIVADGTDQLVGDITITETNNYSLEAATYTVDIVGAQVVNSPVTVTATNAATGETVDSPATLVTGLDGSVSFNLNQTNVPAANLGKVSIKLSGLLLTDDVGSKGPISYTLSGGSIDDFLIQAGDSPAIGDTPPNGVLDDTQFGGTVNQADIQPPPAFEVKALSIPVANRIGGNDRYETAAKIALSQNEEQANIILASGEDFPDALSSGYLANQIGANILLSHKSSLPAVTADAMRTLGTHTVYIIGGTGAISAGVEAKLRATPQWYPGGEVTVGQGKLQVIRLGGADRFATNKIVNQRGAATSGDVSPVGRTQITFGQASKLTALVATGSDFADALSAGPAISGVNTVDSIPLILTRPTTLDPNAKSQLDSLGIEQAVILGGPGAVSAGVESSIAGMGVAIHRIGGLNRFETGTMIADFEVANPTPSATAKGGLGFDSTKAYLATGVDFADALAGGPLASADGGSPMLLTNPTALSPATATWLNANADNYTLIVALGLTGAVSNSTLSAANSAIAGG